MVEKGQEVLDAHHHIWRVDRTPWLSGPPVKRIFGDYEPLRRDYSIAEYASDARSNGVTKSVYVQVNVAPGDEVWEAGWAAEEGRNEGLVQAVVAFADLAAPDVGETIDRQIASAPVRGIRQQLHWHSNPAYRFAGTPDGMLRPEWQRGLRELARRDLHFELQIFQSQFAHALALVDAHPDARFVLLHAGMPEQSSGDAGADWAKGLSAFAARPNVLAKISGLGTFTRRCDVEEWRPIVERTVDAFGPERCMFGSNFPIEKLWTSYATLLETVRSCLSRYSADERRAVLHDTAARFYRI
jgi:predicted TIM-barrel fold metal-dependent hydrolase